MTAQDQKQTKYDTLWESITPDAEDRSKYLVIRIQQDKRGKLVFFAGNKKGYVWQEVSTPEFLHNWKDAGFDNVRAKPIYNKEYLKHALQRAINLILMESCGSYKDVYHDLPNALMELAEQEDYINLRPEERLLLKERQK